MTVPEQATRYAALVALEAAISGEKNKASAVLRKSVAEVGLSKGTVPTPLGAVTLKENKGGVFVRITDEDDLVEWCEENSPESVVTLKVVRAADREQIVTKRFVAVAGKVVDSLSGEVVPFAVVETVDSTPPTPTYGASERQREVKAIAADVAQHRLSLLTDVIAMRVHALDPPEFDKEDDE